MPLFLIADLPQLPPPPPAIVRPWAPSCTPDPYDGSGLPYCGGGRPPDILPGPEGGVVAPWAPFWNG